MMKNTFYSEAILKKPWMKMYKKFMQLNNLVWSLKFSISLIFQFQPDCWRCANNQ